MIIRIFDKWTISAYKMYANPIEIVLVLFTLRLQDTILTLLIYVFNTEAMYGPIIFLNILGG